MRAKLTLVALLVALGISRVEAAPVIIGGTTYLPAGSPETLTALFSQADGAATRGAYRGFVQVTVSGSGQSYGTAFNDAFYVYSSRSPYAEGAYYQMTFGTAPLVGLAPSQDAKNFIAYDLAANAEPSAAYVPKFNPNHTYDLVLNTRTSALANLHFGVSDGDFSDNTGSYKIVVTQLASASEVPEPVSLLPLGFGLLALLAFRYRRPR